jgi:hypothetical protein
MVKQYRKKPVIIEAIQWVGNNPGDVEQFCEGKLTYDICDTAYQVGKGVPVVMNMRIETLEGIMEVSKGDYVIKDVKGEFYPCKPDIFEQTYEEV